MGKTAIITGEIKSINLMAGVMECWIRGYGDNFHVLRIPADLPEELKLKRNGVAFDGLIPFDDWINETLPAQWSFLKGMKELPYADLTIDQLKEQFYT